MLYDTIYLFILENFNGHIQILKGNLAPGGSVAKITGKEGLVFSGPAKVYDCEEDMLSALEQK